MIDPDTLIDESKIMSTQLSGTTGTTGTTDIISVEASILASRLMSLGYHTEIQGELLSKIKSRFTYDRWSDIGRDIITLVMKMFSSEDIKDDKVDRSDTHESNTNKLDTDEPDAELPTLATSHKSELRTSLGTGAVARYIWQVYLDCGTDVDEFVSFVTQAAQT
jgi:hypothetical protein